MGTRIKDIAKRANVSEATVSLSLNQKPGVSVSTRERVLELAREMDYGATRKTLYPDSAGTLQFLKIATHGHTVNRDHTVFIADYIDGLTVGAGAFGYSLEINSFAGIPAEEIISSIHKQNLNGLIVLGTELTPEDIRLFAAIPIPVVFLDTFYDFLPYDFIDMNNTDSVYAIVNHLLEQGHRDIGFVRSSVDTHNFLLRDIGFWKAVEALEIPIKDRHVFNVDSTFQGAYEDMTRQITPPSRLPTALVCTNDIVACGVIRSLKEKGLRVPEDVSVVGFDDLPFSAVMEPPLTTIQVSKKEMGELAIHLLSKRIDGDPDRPPYKIQVGSKLIPRQSVKKIPR